MKSQNLNAPYVKKPAMGDVTCKCCGQAIPAEVMEARLREKRAKRAAYMNRRYHNDPTWREQQLTYAKAYASRKRAERAAEKEAAKAAAEPHAIES
jgi:hypothetical protein